MSPLAHPPDLSSDIAWAVFSATFPRRKPDNWYVHRSQIAQLRFFCSGPWLPERQRRGFLGALRQWSESFAELAGRN